MLSCQQRKDKRLKHLLPGYYKLVKVLQMEMSQDISACPKNTVFLLMLKTVLVNLLISFTLALPLLTLLKAFNVNTLKKEQYLLHEMPVLMSLIRKFLACYLGKRRFS